MIRELDQNHYSVLEIHVFSLIFSVDSEEKQRQWTLVKARENILKETKQMDRSNATLTIHEVKKKSLQCMLGTYVVETTYLTKTWKLLSSKK